MKNKISNNFAILRGQEKILMLKVYFYQGGNPILCFEISFSFLHNFHAVTNKQILMVKMQQISGKKTAPTNAFQYPIQ
jgi:hypothetical protein